jgi:hypothetical protein
MNTPQQKVGTPTKIWPLMVAVLLVVVGFIYWDVVAHRRVQEYVFASPEIPGAGVKGSTEEAATFRHMAHSLTRQGEAGGIKIVAVRNSPEFFNALATAEAAQARDITRHKTLYHDYAEKFDFHGNVVFTIILESASLDLDTYQVKERSLLRNDKGMTVAPSRWLPGIRSSSRHVEGVLFFPQRTETGESMIGHLPGAHLPGEGPPIWLELELKQLPGEQEAVFRWELARDRGEKG